MDRKQAKYKDLIAKRNKHFKSVQFVNLSISSLGVFSKECQTFLKMLNDLDFEEKYQTFCIILLNFELFYPLLVPQLCIAHLMLVLYLSINELIRSLYTNFQTSIIADKFNVVCYKVIVLVRFYSICPLIPSYSTLNRNHFCSLASGNLIKLVFLFIGFSLQTMRLS